MIDDNVQNPTKQSQEKAQTERTERALVAMHTGNFQVTRTRPFQWTVKNGDKLPYVVTLQGDTWACTCMDFQQRGPDLRCKHIEGVRLSETSQQIQSQDPNKETQMDQMNSNPADGLSNRVDRILWELRQPLDMSRVKRRQAPGSGTVPYLEGYDVIDRANAIFGFGWSFDLLAAPVVMRWQKKIVAWNQQERRKVPQMDANGNVQTEDVGIVYVTGKVSVELDGQIFCHSDLGRCIFSGDTPEALDMALAGSVTDCLKRCFRQFGEQFGNSLYDKEIAQNAGLEQTQSGNNGVSGQRTPAASQPPTPARVYGDGTSVNGNPSEQEAYDQFVTHKGKPPVSKADLRTWLSTQRTTAPSVAA